jgi:hypothetical protein
MSLIKPCAFCGQEFAATSPSARYCDTACRTKEYRMFTPPSIRGKRPKQPPAPPSPSPAGLLMALLTGKPTPKPAPNKNPNLCKTCRQPLPENTQLRYCSDPCRFLMLNHLKRLRPGKVLTRRKRAWVRRNVPSLKPHHQPPITPEALANISDRIQEEIAKIHWELGQQVKETQL